jgi:hypothetical protein
MIACLIESGEWKKEIRVRPRKIENMTIVVNYLINHSSEIVLTTVPVGENSYNIPRDGIWASAKPHARVEACSREDLLLWKARLQRTIGDNTTL